MEAGKPTHFTVLTKGAGKAPLDVSFSSPVSDFDIIDNYDYSQTVKYTPVQQVRPNRETAARRSAAGGAVDMSFLQGEQSVTVKFGGDAISKSPFKVGVAAPLDLSKVIVDDLEGREEPAHRDRDFYHILNPSYRNTAMFFSGAEVDQEQQFVVDTKGAGGQGRLEVTVVSVWLRVV